MKVQKIWGKVKFLTFSYTPPDLCRRRSGKVTESFHFNLIFIEKAEMINSQPKKYFPFHAGYSLHDPRLLFLS